MVLSSAWILCLKHDQKYTHKQPFKTLHGQSEVNTLPAGMVWQKNTLIVELTGLLFSRESFQELKILRQDLILMRHNRICVKDKYALWIAKRKCRKTLFQQYGNRIFDFYKMK